MENRKVMAQFRQVAMPPIRAEKTVQKRPVKVKIAEALDQMRDMIRFPLGTSPARDERIKSVWRSGS